MGVCPHCGNDDLRELSNSGNAFCDDCDEVVEPTDDDDSSGEMYCGNCGDHRPVDDDLCCLRCGEHV